MLLVFKNLWINFGFSNVNIAVNSRTGYQWLSYKVFKAKRILIMTKNEIQHLPGPKNHEANLVGVFLSRVTVKIKKKKLD